MCRHLAKSSIRTPKSYSITIVNIVIVVGSSGTDDDNDVINNDASDSGGFYVLRSKNHRWLDEINIFYVSVFAILWSSFVESKALRHSRLKPQSPWFSATNSCRYAYLFSSLCSVSTLLLIPTNKASFFSHKQS
ncbi:hypothetical protein VNO78_11219 [Psophocarpus tetragonolobus]|uniref:Uncharacterized protein n=1 Tax=Psophocarpus tetragonolobus TaxID=3891 RepID=A0AAN9SLY3_PSOTE